MRIYILETFKAIILLFTALFVVSCATKGLPLPENEQSTLLVVNVKNDTVMKKFFVKYRLVFDDGSYISIYPGQGNKYFSYLAPGNYRIVQLQPDYLASNKIGRTSRLNESFTLEAGKITIFPIVFNVLLERKKMETGFDLTQSITLTYMSDLQRDEIISQLAQNENFDQWAILQ